MMNLQETARPPIGPASIEAIEVGGALSVSLGTADGSLVPAHGSTGWMSTVIADLAARLLGSGIHALEQSLQIRQPAPAEGEIELTLAIAEKNAAHGLVRLDITFSDERRRLIASGTATFLLPAAPTPDLASLAPPPEPHRPDRFRRFVDEAKALPPLLTAVVHPCSPEAIVAAVEAHEAGLLTPILVGPEAKIRLAAEQAGVSLAGLAIEPTEHSHAAAERAAEMAAKGLVHALMKGSLHSDELLGAVVSSHSGLRTARRISHVYVLDVPAYPKLLVVTDAAINIAPTLEHKRDICQNAIDFLIRLGEPEPLVAVLAAVETVDPAMPATLDAAALAVMALRGQITGARVDGPLAFDNAISLDAARIKSIVSPVAGRADILLVPDLEAGNMLAKQLIYLAGAEAAGLVLGARVPIILTSRADSLKARLASAALAKLIGAERQGRRRAL